MTVLPQSSVQTLFQESCIHSRVPSVLNTIDFVNLFGRLDILFQALHSLSLQHGHALGICICSPRPSALTPIAHTLVLVCLVQMALAIFQIAKLHFHLRFVAFQPGRAKQILALLL